MDHTPSPSSLPPVAGVTDFSYLTIVAARSRLETSANACRLATHPSVTAFPSLTVLLPLLSD